MTSKPNSKEPQSASTAKDNDHGGTIYERQHHTYRQAKLYKALARDPDLSPAAATMAREMANRAVHARALMDHHVVGTVFPESMSHHRPNAHRLLAELRRAGDDSPEHVERILKLARQAAIFIDGKRSHSGERRKPAEQTKPPKDRGSRNWYS
jgi:hypothetical protein